MTKAGITEEYKYWLLSGKECPWKQIKGHTQLCKYGFTIRRCRFKICRAKELKGYKTLSEQEIKEEQ